MISVCTLSQCGWLQVVESACSCHYKGERISCRSLLCSCLPVYSLTRGGRKDSAGNREGEKDIQFDFTADVDIFLPV